MYINGQWIQAENNAAFDVFNPATGEKFAAVANGDQKDAARAIESAARAFKSWSSLTAYQRSGYLYDAYHIMMDRKEDLARVMTQEQGKPLKAARNEVRYGADFLLWYAEEAKRVYGATIPAP
jgi:succinate-semialdehyde dehydrogenase/glutarate-semialdehyde dehydrogenase